MTQTEVMFLNHSSVIIKYRDEFLLCDPWFDKPAFGSWLPTFPLFVHPTYISVLGDKLTILISHGHDDHCDDDFLQLFNKNTLIVSSNFASPSVEKRIKKIGFDNYRSAGEDGIKVNSFEIRSYRNDDISEDDAIYTIETPDALIVHCNDNWFSLQENHVEALRDLIEKKGRENTLYMSQTNSASGFPLNYQNFDDNEKKKILKEKVFKMISTGMTNASRVGAKYFHSYAGYASVFVKDKMEYLENSLFPTPDFIKKEMSDRIPENVEVLDFYPGDIFDFHSVRKSFFTGSYSDEKIKEHSTKFYSLYGQIDKCDSFRAVGDDLSSDEANELLSFFLTNFNEFVKRKTEANGFESSILGKKLKISVPDLEISMGIEFGKGIISEDEFDDYNKEIITSGPILNQLLRGEILFENLYTGYNAEFKRNPKDVYNRDIVMYMVMFSYVYKNRLAPAYFLASNK